jgi:FKBP12-rapamycin complex-associated protein
MLDKSKFSELRKKLSDGTVADTATKKLMFEAVRTIEAEFGKNTSLDMFDIAPGLAECAPNLIAMPGFYDVEKPYPKIAQFMQIAQLIPSLQRPRKIRVLADSGRLFKYLLKGGEDLRVDQRVMEWLSLADSILRNDKGGHEKNLQIVRYPIIPLASQAGLIAWAEGGVTLYKLIHWAKTAVKVPNEPSWEQVEGYTLIQKLEKFQEMRTEMPNHLLAAAIWLRSESPDLWFTQKMNFARPVAVMSIVGYLIGLGDRHPSNIMFMKKSGHAVHIDFCDSFDKAKFRTNVPEFVPFRLTRMIVKALGISGTEGVFKMTGRFVMNRMRRNRVSLLAFLDIFDKIVDIRDGREPPDVQVRRKLSGRDRNEDEEMTPEDQFDWLVEQATNDWNLTRMYIGWKPTW